MGKHVLRVDLRRLILGLCLLSVVWALISALYASYLVQRETLLAHTQELNRVYAAKLASTTENLLTDLGLRLAYSAGQLSDMETNPERIAQEIHRQKYQSSHFNSIVVVSADGVFLDLTPPTPGLYPGYSSPSPAAREPLEARKPLMSPAFKSAATGRWVILYSHPIFSKDGRYLGYIGGTLYLHSANILNMLLSSHDYRDGSQLYVFSREGTVLYHPDESLIGQPLPTPNLAQDMQQHGNGVERFRDENGMEMLAGYASVPSTGWIIVAQRPTVATLDTLGSLLLETLRNTVPLLLIALLSIWWLSKLIARPLWQLASIARNMEEATSADAIRTIKSWYFEAAQLKRAILTGLSSVHDKMRDLRRESTTDPLTGLLNRRGLERALEVFQKNDLPVAVIIIDIDHFKLINDRYGHDMGDAIIRQLAQLMSQGSRSDDALARSGGEEFVILLPRAAIAHAVGVAERIRKAMMNAPNPLETPATVSLGVARYPDHGPDVEAVISRADQALYHAKNNGRNAICVVDNTQPKGLRLLRNEHR